MLLAHFYSIIVLFFILSSTHQQRGTIDETDIRDKHHDITKYIAILLFTVSLLYGTVINMLMLVVLFCNEDNIYDHAFVLIALQIIISNLISFLPQLIFIVPEILQITNNLDANQMLWIRQIFLSFTVFSYCLIFHSTFLLAINRFVTFILPKYKVFFESKRLYFIIALIWLLNLAIAISDYYLCARNSPAWNMRWEKRCGNSNTAGTTLEKVVYIWLIFIFNAMFLMYAAIFYSIRSKSHEIRKTYVRRRINAMKTYNYEWSILIRAAWKCGVPEIGMILARFLPSYLIENFGEEIMIPWKIFINCYFISACAVFPTIHFIYCKKARSVIKRRLCRWFYSRVSSSQEEIRMYPL